MEKTQFWVVAYRNVKKNIPTALECFTDVAQAYAFCQVLDNDGFETMLSAKPIELTKEDLQDILYQRKEGNSLSTKDGNKAYDTKRSQTGTQ